MKRIAVLTSGGDSPGMNAAIRAIVRTGISLGVEVVGVRHGFQGLVDGDFTLMDASSVSGIINRGGTILHSARSMDFKTKEGFQTALDNLSVSGIEGLIVIGGNGSQTGNFALYEAGFKVMGVASTIDNDLYGTDTTIGFKTAVNTALECVDKLRDTATSHERIFIVEVMGRSRGFVALNVGIAGGAEVVLIPELPFTVDDVVNKLSSGIARGKKSSLIVVAEGAIGGLELERQLKEKTDYSIRTSVLGHIQRGGAPVAEDRLFASQTGAYAVKFLLDGMSGELVGEINNTITTTPLKEVFTKDKPLDKELVELVSVFSI